MNDPSGGLYGQGHNISWANINPTKGIVFGGVEFSSTTSQAPAASTVSSVDSIAISYTIGGTYTVHLFDSTGTIELASQVSTNSGSFTVPSGTYQVGLTAPGQTIGPKSSQITGARVHGDGADVPAPTHWWPMGEASGNCADSKGSITLTQSGTVPRTAGYRLANALSFNHNASNYFTASSMPVNIITTPCTLDFWCKAGTSVGATTNLISFGDGSVGSQMLAICVGNGLGFIFNRPGIGNFGGGTPQLVLNTWVHVHITITLPQPINGGNPNNTYKTYINGVLSTTTADDTTTLSAITGAFLLGNNPNNFDDPAIHAIADLKIYNSVLTAQQIRGLCFQGIAPVDPYTGLLYPSIDAPRAVFMPTLFSNRDQTVFMPGANGVPTTLPLTAPDWTVGSLIASYGHSTFGGASAGITVTPSPLMVVAAGNGNDMTLELPTLGSGTDNLVMSDGTLTCTVAVQDTNAGTNWNTTDAAALKAFVTSTFTAAEFSADGPNIFPYGYVIPGAGYPVGQWDWDSSWATYTASRLGGAYITAAKGWMKSKSGYATSSGPFIGMIPITVYLTGQGPGGATGAYPYTCQVPLTAWAVNQLFIKDGSTDTAWLTFLYTWLKNSMAFHENIDNDGTNVYGLSAYDTSGLASDAGVWISRSRADDDGTTNDSYWITTELIPSQTQYWRTTFCDPERSSAIAMGYDAMANIATALGHSSDATTYTAQAAAIRAAIKSLMWDEVQKRFQWVERGDEFHVIGSSGVAVAGNSTITVTADNLMWLPAGCKVTIANVVCQPITAYELQAGVPTVVTVTSPLTGNASGGARYRNFAEVDNCGMQAAPLWAQCATNAQAASVASRLTAVLDGITPTAWECWFGSTLRNNIAQRTPWVQWVVYQNAAHLTANPTELVIANGNIGLRIGYRRTDSGNIMPALGLNATYNGLQYLHTPWEQVNAAHPLTVTVTWRRNGAVAPTITVQDFNLSTVATVTPAVPAGTDGQPVSATVTVTTAHMPGVVEISAGNGDVAIKYVKITTVPKGWTYLSPQGGLLSTHRFSRVAMFKPAIRSMEYSNATWMALDYWNGDAWPPQNFWAIVGLNNYGLAAGKTIGSEYARRMLLEAQAWTAYVGPSQGVWERSSANGFMTGSANYCWGSLLWAAGIDLGYIPLT